MGNVAVIKTKQVIAVPAVEGQKPQRGVVGRDDRAFHGDHAARLSAGTSLSGRSLLDTSLSCVSERPLLGCARLAAVLCPTVGPRRRDGGRIPRHAPGAARSRQDTPLSRTVLRRVRPLSSHGPAGAGGEVRRRGFPTGRRWPPRARPPLWR